MSHAIGNVLLRRPRSAHDVASQRAPRSSSEVGRKQLDRLLTDAEAAGLVYSAVEEFAQGLASVIRRF